MKICVLKFGVVVRGGRNWLWLIVENDEREKKWCGYVNGGFRGWWWCFFLRKKRDVGSINNLTKILTFAKLLFLVRNNFLKFVCVHSIVLVMVWIKEVFYCVRFLRYWFFYFGMIVSV